MELARQIEELKVPKNKIGIFWLGNASFVLKTDNNKVIFIDPYLSNCVERIYGFKRIYPSLIKSSEVIADIILITHEHEDHFDVDSIPEIMQKNNSIKLVAPHPCITKALEMGVDKDKLIKVKKGDKLEFDGFKIITVYANHGDLAPEAVGYIIIVKKKKIYVTGDTSYTPEKMTYVFSLKPDIVIAPINGKYNNLNPMEAALMGKNCEAKIVIPSHFWMFAEHNGDLASFIESVNKIAKTEYLLFSIGEYHLL